MNFRGVNSIFNSQGLKLESSPVIFLRKENQLQRHPTRHQRVNSDHAKILILEKRSLFYAQGISSLPKLLTTKNSKKGCLYAGITGKSQFQNQLLISFLELAVLSRSKLAVLSHFLTFFFFSIPLLYAK